MKPVIRINGLMKKFQYPVRDGKRNWLKNLLWPEYKTILAVDDISLTIGEGERVAFIGPNGAGKSTTIKMLTGILYPSAGQIEVMGYVPSEQRQQLAYQIGTVFGQRSQLFPNLPVSDSLRFFGVMYDMPDKDIKYRIKELAGLFKLDSFINQPVRKLSLGQRMRAEVCASLMHRPRLIMLDEPTIGLDVVAKKALRDLLLKINTEEGTTILLTSHDVGDIESICERAIIINQGKIIKDTATSRLKKVLGNFKEIRLLPVNEFIKFKKLPAGMKYIVKDTHKIVVKVDLNKTELQMALQKLLALFEVVDVDVYETDLESVIRHVYEQNETN